MTCHAFRTRLFAHALVAALLIAASQAAQATVAYREVFPNSTGANRPIGEEGWYVHFVDGTVATGETSIGNPVGSVALDPVASNPTQSDFIRGYYYRNGFAASAQNKDYLYWTDEFSLEPMSLVESIQWDQRNSVSTDPLQAAIRLDVPGTPADTSDDLWFASTQAFTHADGEAVVTAGGTWYTMTVDFATANWLALDFVPNSSLALGTPSTLPTTAALTGFGIYAPNLLGPQRLDNYTINAADMVPEPATLALLAFGALPLLRRRRRA